jgi:NifU-like protein
MEEALKITNQDIANYLGGLPKKKCTARSWVGGSRSGDCHHYREKPVEEAVNVICKCFESPRIK